MPVASRRGGSPKGCPPAARRRAAACLRPRPLRVGLLVCRAGHWHTDYQNYVLADAVLDGGNAESGSEVTQFLLAGLREGDTDLRGAGRCLELYLPGKVDAIDAGKPRLRAYLVHELGEALLERRHRHECVHRDRDEDVPDLLPAVTLVIQIDDVLAECGASENAAKHVDHQGEAGALVPGHG